MIRRSCHETRARRPQAAASQAKGVRPAAGRVGSGEMHGISAFLRRGGRVFRHHDRYGA